MTTNNLSQTEKDLIVSFSDSITYVFRLSEKTREVYTHEASLFLSYLSSEEIRLEDCVPLTIESYIVKRTGEEKLDERTVSKILSALRSFFRFLMNEHIVSRNPAKEVKKPKEGVHLPRTIS